MDEMAILLNVLLKMRHFILFASFDPRVIDLRSTVDDLSKLDAIRTTNNNERGPNDHYLQALLQMRRSSSFAPFNPRFIVLGSDINDLCHLEDLSAPARTDMDEMDILLKLSLKTKDFVFYTPRDSRTMDLGWTVSDIGQCACHNNRKALYEYNLAHLHKRISARTAPSPLRHKHSEITNNELASQQD